MIQKNGFGLTQYTIRVSTLSAYAKFVAICIADAYNQKLEYSFVSYEALAEQTGLSRATVGRAVKEIKDSGEWEIVSGHGGRKNKNHRTDFLARANQFRPNWEDMNKNWDARTTGTAATEDNEVGPSLASDSSEVQTPTKAANTSHRSAQTASVVSVSQGPEEADEPPF